MLKLRLGVVRQAHPPQGKRQELIVELEGAPRATVVDLALHSPSGVGDEVIVSVHERTVHELDPLGGEETFDILHANLTRGLSAQGESSANVTKLGGSSLRHLVNVVERERLALPLERPVAVLALHSQLAPVAFAFARACPGLRLGYVQTDGGALGAAHSRTVGELRSRGLLAGHVTAGAAFGGESEAVTTIGALHHGIADLGWDAAVCGPGPGIVGSGSRLGHDGMRALDSAHIALALGCVPLVVARMSSADPRLRHRGISHHTLTVLDLVLAPVTVALPAGMRSPVGAELRAGLGAVFGAAMSSRPQLDLDVERPARIARHDWRRAPVDLPGYAHSALPIRAMGRGVQEDPLFFAAALAAGTVLSELCAGDAHGDGRAKDERDEALEASELVGLSEGEAAGRDGEESRLDGEAELLQGQETVLAERVDAGEIELYRQREVEEAEHYADDAPAYDWQGQ
jgi:Protein of unknown function (DUF3866)